jgi:hypothetical protein
MLWTSLNYRAIFFVKLSIANRAFAIAEKPYTIKRGQAAKQWTRHTSKAKVQKPECILGCVDADEDQGPKERYGIEGGSGELW